MAQQPVTPADSAEPAVTIPIPDEELSPDTIPEQVQGTAEVEVVATTLPIFPMIGRPGWDAARWEWSREDLDRFPGITIGEFIQRIPGVLRFRAGGFGRPEGVTVFGAGGGRTRVFLNGVELDPLGHGTFPLETLAVLDVSRIRVDRSLSELRVDIQTFLPAGVDPHSVVELGTGVYETRMLRALFSRGFGTRITGTAGLDIANTGGLGIVEDYGSSNAYFRGTYALNARSGLGWEMRRTGVDRAGAVFPEESSRSEVALRYRNQPSDASVFEAVVSRSTFGEAGHQVVSSAAEPVEHGVTQGLLRAAYGTERIGGEATIRGRMLEESGPALPFGELEGRLSGRPWGMLNLDAEGRFSAAEGASAIGGSLTGTLTPSRALSFFGSLALGTRLTPLRETANAVAAVPSLFPGKLLKVDVNGWRAGAQLAGREDVFGFAIFEQGESTLAPFGLGFDLNLPSYSGGAVRGLEGSLHSVIPRTAGTLALQGSFVYLLDGGGRPYLPTEYGRAGLFFTDTYFAGQLEPSLRIEGIHRGEATVPSQARTAFTAVAPAYQTLNLSLHIRIIDVRLFLDWENLISNQAARDFPYTPAAFPRIVYGANWHFSN